MNNETMLLLEQQFDTAFAAPDGIQKLRELILTLAMQGKLVPQDPKDQPASELLKEIELEKKRLVKEGKIKQSKPLPEITPEEIPHVLPDSWKWVRISQLASIQTGKKDVNQGHEDGLYPFFSCAAQPLKSNEFSFDCEALLLPGNGANVGLVTYYIGKFEAYQRTYIINDFFKVSPRYIENTLKSRFLKSLEGKQYGSAINYIKLGNLTEFLIPLPPLAEQRRIVAKIDQLMACCDELEKLRSDRAQKLITVHTAALNCLLTAQDSHDFTTAWHFITQHFGELYTVKETVAELRKTILQLAVMGKLVPQDPNDEPASELLKAIELEKQQLVKEGKIRQSIILSEINREEVPYKLPNGWEWEQLGNFGYILGGGTPSKSNLSYWNGNIPWVSPKDMKVDYVSDSQDHISEIALQNSTTKLIPKGALLIVVRGMILAHSFPVGITTSAVTINQDIKALCPYISSISNYLLLLTKGRKPFFLSLVERSSHGTCRLETNRLLSALLPLPPLAEQHRIVAKVDQLMALCDRLEGAIASAQTKQTDLLNAVMAQV